MKPDLPVLDILGVYIDNNYLDQLTSKLEYIFCHTIISGVRNNSLQNIL